MPFQIRRKATLVAEKPIYVQTFMKISIALGERYWNMVTALVLLLKSTQVGPMHAQVPGHIVVRRRSAALQWPPKIAWKQALLNKNMGYPPIM